MGREDMIVRRLLIVVCVLVILVTTVRVLFSAQREPPSGLQQEVMNSSDMTTLLLCQTRKVYKDLGVPQGKLTTEIIPRSIEEKETMQEILWDEGYV